MEQPIKKEFNGHVGLTRNRHKDKSLGFLTKQFVDLMKNQQLGILDIRKVCLLVFDLRTSPTTANELHDELEQLGNVVFVLKI
jgi:hypothetical protein